MSYLKYIFLMLGLGLINSVKIKYMQRTSKIQNSQYTKKEQTVIYIGYGCCAVAILLVILFN